jgi:hypothetical protein
MFVTTSCVEERLPYHALDMSDTERRLRRLMLALVAFGLVALFGELLALEHFEDGLQFIPLAALGAALLNVLWVAMTGRAAAVRTMQIVFVLLIATGLVGVVLHYQGNAEFQRDIDPEIAGWALFTTVLHAKAPPALAPGVMAQLGLLGLIYTYRHPATRIDRTSGAPGL